MQSKNSLEERKFVFHVIRIEWYSECLSIVLPTVNQQRALQFIR